MKKTIFFWVELLVFLTLPYNLPAQEKRCLCNILTGHFCSTCLECCGGNDCCDPSICINGTCCRSPLVVCGNGCCYPADCVQGECCPVGQLGCNGKCCPSGKCCDNKDCCGEFEACCGGKCVSSPCRDCGGLCEIGICCGDGMCCPPGKTCCDGTCVDSKPCDSCGFVCTDGTCCGSGKCCAPGTECCNGVCKSLADCDDDLAIELEAFYSNSNSNSLQKIITLQWLTMTEKSASHFEVQRSLNAKDWVQIGKVSAKGNSKNMEKYSFKDSSPNPITSYYRLKMVDLDGTYFYSKIIYELFSNSNNLVFAIIPNPSQGNFTLEFTQPPLSKMTISINDLAGNIVLEKNYLNKVKKMEISVDASLLPVGFYFIKIKTRFGNSVQKLFINY